MRKVHVVNHTHWDREWYFTTSDALVLSDDVFTEILDELEKNPEAKFCLDGQISILEEYLQLRPERTGQVKKLVSQKRLAIGPWYTQTDAFFVDAESIIRNLAIGIKESKKYGDPMRVGYLPDTFGFNAQMPTILKNCGIDNIIFWRGIHLQKHVKRPYFIWKGLGEKAVIAANLVDGYGTAAFLNDSDEYLDNRLFPAVEKLKKMTDQQELLITAGGDQLRIVEDLPQKLAAINKKTQDQYVVSSYETFIDFLRGEKDLEEYQGEFREPCTARVHKSIGSVRYDIKRTNFRMEQKLLKRIEPLMAIARANGIEVSTNLLTHAWKKLLEGQAHDGMGGCVTDPVAADILHRMKAVDEIADSIENLIAKRLSEKIGLKENEILVFNTLPKKFKGYKIVEFMHPSKNVRFEEIEDAVLLEAVYYEGKNNLLLESPEGPKYVNEAPYYRLKVLIPVELPAMGYRVIRFAEGDAPLPELKETEAREIGNEHYRISYQDNDLVLETKFGKRIKGFIRFEDCGNDGDTYDFSPLPGDQPELLSLALKDVKTSSLIETMTLEGDFLLPRHLDDRLKENGEKDRLRITLEISLRKGEEIIDCRCTVDNRIYSHRLRVKINTDIHAKETIASLPFGYIRRPILNGNAGDWKKDYVEMPIDIEPFDASVSVEEENYHVSAFGKGIKEYQHIGDSLYLTLFATTGQLGKPNLVTRPGRASGDTTKKGHVMIPTPQAELIGTLDFEFALCVKEGKFDELGTAKLWEAYSSEHISYQSQTLNKFVYRLDNKIQPRYPKGTLPREFSLLEVESDSLFSSFSPSLYDDRAFLLRLKNPTGGEKKLENYDFRRFAHVLKTNCIEEISEDQDFRLPPYDTLTLKLWL
jgi:mannosylglycerate hydrolase